MPRARGTFLAPVCEAPAFFVCDSENLLTVAARDASATRSGIQIAAARWHHVFTYGALIQHAHVHAAGSKALNTLTEAVCSVATLSVFVFIIVDWLHPTLLHEQNAHPTPRPRTPNVEQHWGSWSQCCATFRREGYYECAFVSNCFFPLLVLCYSNLFLIFLFVDPDFFEQICFIFFAANVVQHWGAPPQCCATLGRMLPMLKNKRDARPPRRQC